MNTLERLVHWNIMQSVKTLNSKQLFVPGSMLSSSDPFRVTVGGRTRLGRKLKLRADDMGPRSQS